MHPDGFPMPGADETILEEAERLVFGDRRRDYGHPRDDWSRTAALWSALLSDKLSEPITAAEGVMCMVLVKLSREINRGKRDNRVDIAGYAACLDLIQSNGSLGLGVPEDFEESLERVAALAGHPGDVGD